MCKTIRRAERSTHTASLSNRSRSVVTCASAQAVPAARRRSSWNSTYAASVSRTRNWLAKNFSQLVRSISSPLMQFLEPVLDVPPPAVRTGKTVSGSSARFRHHKRGLFFGSRPGCRTTSALMITRRLRCQLRAAYRVSPYRCAV